jgi:integrase
VKWTPPKLAEEVDWRVVIGPRQMRECLTAVTYVGQRGRGRRLRALFACMYYAALRPAEAVALYEDDCHLPASGWGRLVLTKSLPESGARWTNSGSTHERRGLKLRPVEEIRTVPIPPVLVKILREHIATFGTAEDGRLFQTERGGVVGSTAYGDVWAATRVLAFTPAQVASPLARRPYDLRHAGVSLWLNSGIPATEVAERAGHSVKVLLQNYAKCIEGQQDGANRRIDDALED